jgi:hypothetical protein
MQMKRKAEPPGPADPTLIDWHLEQRIKQKRRRNKASLANDGQKTLRRSNLLRPACSGHLLVPSRLLPPLI